ncbi:MAG TPA: 3-deoxy-7-phosphoheptulonate synthase [Acidobacteriota bacterium]
MIVIMQAHAPESEVEAVIDRLTELGFDVHRSTGVDHTVLGAVGRTPCDPRALEILPGVRQVVRVSEPYKLASRTFRPQDTVIEVQGLKLGGPEVVVIAGPCSVESPDQIQTAAKIVRQAGCRALRGGAFKPRTSPYSFQGLGEEALRWLRRAADREELLVVTEVMDTSQITTVAKYADILQVGARNMQNYALLKELGKLNKPVLLKRGLAGTIEELLMSAEYLLAGGNYQVILCERGIRTFETAARNTLDLCAIPIVHKLSHLPILADPSHGTGLRDKVAPMARAAVAAGADGLLIEVHPEPEKAVSDGVQSLLPEDLFALMEQLKIIATAVGRRLA